jgi:hypothetical protein
VKPDRSAPFGKYWRSNPLVFSLLPRCQARGVLKKELIKHLRTGRRFRYARRSASGELRGKIPETISIRERPAEAEDRAIPGHWEGDLLCGTKSSQIITLVERHSRYTALIKVADHKTENVVAALTRHVRSLPKSLRRSLTWDHGKEMSQHASFSVATDVQVYFCDPSSCACTADELRLNTWQISRMELPAFHLRHMSAFCPSVRPGRPSFSIGTTFYCHVRSDGVALIN